MSVNPQKVATLSLLPKTKTPPKQTFNDLTILVYGRSKIGKTTFCSHFENALFLATEAGHNHLEVFQTTVNNWIELLTVIAELAKGEHQFKTIVLDTVDNAFAMCREYILSKEYTVNGQKTKITHESDLGYGKGFTMVMIEFKRVLNKVTQLPYGVVFISHCKEQEIDTRTGKINKIVPSVQGQGKEAVLAICDMVLYCDMEIVNKEENRVIKTKPTIFYDAGDRTGKLPEKLELDYKAFYNAYYQVTQNK